MKYKPDWYVRHNIEDRDKQLARLLTGDWQIVGYIHTPHGVLRVLLMRWDDHYLVHLDQYGTEFFFHTNDERFVERCKTEPETIIWQDVLGIVKAEYETFSLEDTQ